MLLLMFLCVCISLGLAGLANAKAKTIEDENIKLRLENNIMQTELKDARQQIKSYIDCPEQLWQV